MGNRIKRICYHVFAPNNYKISSPSEHRFSTNILSEAEKKALIASETSSKTLTPYTVGSSNMKGSGLGVYLS